MNAAAKKALDAINASIQFAPAVCREAMELARVALADRAELPIPAEERGRLRELAKAVPLGDARTGLDERAGCAAGNREDARVILRLLDALEAPVPLLVDDRPIDQRLAELMFIAKPAGAPIAIRRRLSDERNAITHHFSIVRSEGYLTTGEYEDGSLGELFIRFNKESAVIDGDGVRDLIASRNALLDQFGIAVSMLLQTGTTLAALVAKFTGTKFPPQGWTGNPNAPNASSPIDYVFRWLEWKYSKGGRDVKRTASASEKLVTEQILALIDNASEATAETEPVYVRCQGDGENGCGHPMHHGPCTKRPYSGPQCSCTGTPGY